MNFHGTEPRAYEFSPTELARRILVMVTKGDPGPFRPTIQCVTGQSARKTMLSLAEIALATLDQEHNRNADAAENG